MGRGGFHLEVISLILAIASLVFSVFIEPRVCYGLVHNDEPYASSESLLGELALGGVMSGRSGVLSPQWRIQGGAHGSWPPPWGPGAPRACQGHHRPARGTTGLSGAPQGHHRSSRSTTSLSGAPQARQRYHKSASAQGHQRPSRGTTGLPGARWACQGHDGPVRGTAGLSGAPQA